jgi:branched-chain amino acid transport system substrate-binding protein
MDVTEEIMRTMQKLRTLILAGGVLALAGTAAMAEDSYKIGVSEPLSGAASSLGVPVVDSVKAAAEVINANGGINGRKIELVIRDDQSKPDIAVQNFRRLSEEGVYAMIGPNQGSNTLAVSAIVKQAKVPTCAFNNTIAITKQNNPYIFRCQTSDADNVKAALLFAHDKLKAKKIGVLYTSDAYGSDAYAALQKEAEAMGMPVVGAEKVNYGATDTTAEWTKLLGSKPEAIILWGSGSTMSIALRNASQLGNTAPIIGAQGVAASAIIQGAGAAAEGIYMVTLTAPDQVTEGQKDLAKIYKEKNGDDYQLTIYDTIGWDALHLITKAIENAGGDRDKMLEGFEKISKYQLAAGTYTYTSGNHEGLGVDSVWIVQVKDGRMVGVQHGL